LHHSTRVIKKKKKYLQAIGGEVARLGERLPHVADEEGAVGVAEQLELPEAAGPGRRVSGFI